jgi:hypothetical protein
MDSDGEGERKVYMGAGEDIWCCIWYMVVIFKVLWGSTSELIMCLNVVHAQSMTKIPSWSYIHLHTNCIVHVYIGGSAYDAGDKLVFETSSDVHVVPTFDAMGLKEDLLRGIYAYGFEKPSAIQQRAIIPIIKGRDTIAQSQSG